MTRLASVARAKAHPLLAGADDTYLGYLLDAASEAVEVWCNRVFTSAEFTEKHDGNGRIALFVRNLPVTDLASIAILDPDGETETIDNSGDDQFVYDAATGRVEFLPTHTATHGSFTRGFQNITVVYTAGYASNAIPQPVQELVARLAGALWEWGASAGFKVPGADSETLGKYSYKLKDQAKRMIATDRDIQEMLYAYRVLDPNTGM
jgi:uncharacterized phiE125 gp8 family phage protein